MDDTYVDHTINDLDAISSERQQNLNPFHTLTPWEEPSTKYEQLSPTTPTPADPVENTNDNEDEHPSFVKLLDATKKNSLEETDIVNDAEDKEINNHDGSEDSSHESDQDKSVIKIVENTDGDVLPQNEVSLVDGGTFKEPEADMAEQKTTVNSLYSSSQTNKFLQEHGVKNEVKDKSVEFHTSDGDFIMVKPEIAYRVTKVSKGCQETLEDPSLGDLFDRWQTTASEMIENQKIANLLALAEASMALKNSNLIRCIPTLAHDLENLIENCQKWAESRKNVSKLIHGSKKITKQINKAQKHLNTLQEISIKDQSRIADAISKEKKIAKIRRPVIINTLRATLEKMSMLNMNTIPV